MARFAHKSDFTVVKRLWSVCFEDTAEFVDWNFENNYSPGNTIVEEWEGAPVSAMQSIPFSLMIKGQRFSAEGIWGVSTDPDFRGRGLARSLFEFGLPAVRLRGCEISILGSAVKGMYEKFGYTHIYNAGSFDPPHISGEYTNALTDQLIEKLDGAYKSAMADKDIYVERDREYWKKTLCTFFEMSKGKVLLTHKGYALIYPTDNGCRAKEICGIEINSDIYDVMPLMARIINAPSVIKKLAGHLESGSVISVRDGLVPENNCSFRIENGKAYACDASAEAMDISELTDLVFRLCGKEKGTYIGFPLEI